MNMTMNISTFRRLSFAPVAATAALMCATSSFAAPSQRAVEVLASRGVAANAELPAHASANSGVRGMLNPGVLNAPEVELTLSDGRKITARQQRVAQDDAKGTQSWIGTFDDSPGSVLVLSKAKGAVTGYANYKELTLEILPAASGKHLQFAVDNNRLPMGDGVKRSSGGGAGAGDVAVDYGTGGTTLAASNAVVQDLLVVYTAAAASKWGQATLESMIQSAVVSANQAYQNSQANISVNVVGLQQVAISESGSGMQTTLSNLTKNTEVRGLREKLAADMVVLVSQDSDWCGYASLAWTSNGITTNYDAYAVTYSSCLSNQTLAHELGHLQGLDHNRENAGSSAEYPYSYGYRICGSAGFLDIMSYQCSTSTPRVLNFSNPYVSYNGYATGISYEADPARSAETARTLNNTATKVAGYRVSSTATAPAAPSSMAVQSAAYDKVTVGWTDNAANETGFTVQRSNDGVTFSDVATLGADARSYSDATVAERSSYYYRVRAFNSSGASSFSNTASVTTPVRPPPPPPVPTTVTAGNNGNGTATIAWTVSSTNATSFEVRREKYDSRRGTWSGATTAATVPASVFSVVDSTGAGTFRYSVRAVNAGGASAYRGPVSVTVTSSTSTKKNPGARAK